MIDLHVHMSSPMAVAQGSSLHNVDKWYQHFWVHSLIIEPARGSL